MRISSLHANATADRDVGETRFPLSQGRPALPPARKAAPQPPRQAAGSLGNRDPLLNRQLSSAQQSLGYLDELDARLQALKSDLSNRLVAQQPGDAALERKLRDFAGLWRERQALSGGSLDSQLAYGGGAEARQRFQIRGLDLRNLQAGDKETLTFSVGGDSPRLLSVSIEPGLSPEALIRRFDQAFAPANIRVAPDSRGEPTFSVAESAWPALRDALAVKGKGIRFPSGQLTRVKTTVEGEAISPESWQTRDMTGLRRTLQEVVKGQDRVREVREGIGRVLTEARSRFAASPVLQDGDWATGFVADFQALAGQPDYPVFSALAPALTAIDRHRVVALLALD
ncbi:MAG: hypothetical protein H6R10_2049 [Rhodocyclaceae bacterium]|nr:hypothetical protein [Rhodocyclaceae bacterium]